MENGFLTTYLHKFCWTFKEWADAWETVHDKIISFLEQEKKSENFY